MKLKAHSRPNGLKSTLGEIRRRKDIPAVLYSKGEPGVGLWIEGNAFAALMRDIKKSCLSTTVFTLDVDGKTVRALVKEIQYHPTTYQVWHLDFIELHSDVKVSLNVPIQFTGEAECVGIKLGGFLREVVRTIPVSCLPGQIPSQFSLDIRDLEMFGKKRLKDIAMPAGVKPLVDLEQVAVVVGKR